MLKRVKRGDSNLFPAEYKLLPNTSELFELELAYEETTLNNGFTLAHKIVKPIKGIQNTMKAEYILFLRKRRQQNG